MSSSKSKWKKSSAKKEVSSCSSSSTSSWSSDDEDDGTVLKAIKDYLSNRMELAHQLFKSVKAEKIRMMLPQILKNIDMTELEELCASELSGMSKSRILSILNGTPMINSSDSSESNDSGPSLEIISDTETWISDNESQNCSSSYSRDKGKSNKKTKLQRHNGSTNIKVKSKGKSSTSGDITSVKIKKEKEQIKNPEGESLLDLLELEMRARAIKALIRKEEDIVSTLDSEQKNKADIPTTMVNCDKSNERNVIVESAIQNTLNNENESEQISTINASIKSVDIDEDQDVVMLVNPTPMINLLSSDSEIEDKKKRTTKEGGIKRSKKKLGSQVIKCESKDAISCSSSEVNSGERINCSTNIEDIDANKETSKNVNKKNNSHKNKKLSNENLNSLKLNVNRKIIKIEKQNDKELSRDDNKLVDEEIIDLDDYPDGMEDIDNYEHVSPRIEKPTDKNNTTTDFSSEKSDNSGLNSAETWATRYYQTDSVQNVIKESKIQSEIRKRLRERQKLSKLNITPKNIQMPSVTNDKEAEQINNELKLTGSVQEYLALEATTNVTRVVNSLPQNIKLQDIDDNTKSCDK